MMLPTLKLNLMRVISFILKILNTNTFWINYPKTIYKLHFYFYKELS